MVDSIACTVEEALVVSKEVNARVAVMGGSVLEGDSEVTPTAVN